MLESEAARKAFLFAEAIAPMITYTINVSVHLERLRRMNTLLFLRRQLEKFNAGR